MTRIGHEWCTHNDLRTRPAVEHDHDSDPFADGVSFHLDTMHGMGNAGAYITDDLVEIHESDHAAGKAVGR